MDEQHSLRPLWIGIVCMVAGVALIYWVFHSGKHRETAPVDDVVCAQVLTTAKNPDTGKEVTFPTPCDVPAGWEVVQPVAQ